VQQNNIKLAVIIGKMMSDITSKILTFYSELQKDKNHRYKSWEHCYSYFRNSNPDENIACLHLAFYLASWGMYRGSSFLLWKDYLIHLDVVKKILNNRTKVIDIKFDDKESISKYINNVFCLIDWIKNYYKNNIHNVNGKKKEINISDTLVTKILLGTTGCIPAYDRYVISGMREKGIKYSKLTKKQFKSVIEFYKSYKKDFENAQKEINNASSVRYPIMKLVDMYLWQIGFEKENNENNS